MADCEILGKFAHTFVNLTILEPSAPKPKCDIIINRHMREKRAILKDKSNFSPVDLLVGNIFAIEKYPAGVGTDNACYGLKQYALAYAGGAEQNKILTLPHFE